MPIVRLEIDNMKKSILSHLGVIGSELGDRLAAEIEEAIESYSWGDRVKFIVHEAIEARIQDYFSFGEGGRKIKDAINEGFKGL